MDRYKYKAKYNEHWLFTWCEYTAQKGNYVDKCSKFGVMADFIIISHVVRLQHYISSHQ